MPQPASRQNLRREEGLPCSSVGLPHAFDTGGSTGPIPLHGVHGRVGDQREQAGARCVTKDLQCSLLCAVRAAKVAAPTVHASLHIPWHRPALHSEGVCPLDQEVVVLVHRVVEGRGVRAAVEFLMPVRLSRVDVHHLRHLGEGGVEVFSKPVNTEVADPLPPDVRRQPKRGTPIDGRPSSHAAPSHDGDALVPVRQQTTIFKGILKGLHLTPLRKVSLAKVLTFLHHRHAKALLGEDAGSHAATGPRSDNDNVIWLRGRRHAQRLPWHTCLEGVVFHLGQCSPPLSTGGLAARRVVQDVPVGISHASVIGKGRPKEQRASQSLQGLKELRRGDGPRR
eukprot:scaffold245_cov256-Pinguiococcus_pyrenoidosus.AAC.50